MPGIVSVEVKSQRTRNHESLSEAVYSRRPRRVIPKIIADSPDPFSHDPETIGPKFRYFVTSRFANDPSL